MLSTTLLPLMKLAFLVLALLAALPARAQTPADATPGLLVMAHGGDDAWNAAVEAAVAPLRDRYPVAVAYGMADPASLGQGLDALANQGVTRVAVVRLFLDGRSFLHQTEYFLGLRPDAPERFILHAHGDAGGGHHGGHGSAPPEPVPHGLDVALSYDGLMQAAEVGAILAARAAALSEAPADESVLLLAHGTGNDVENARWIAAMEHLSGDLRGLGFHSVRAETLREDWPDSREAAERAIRGFVSAETEAGRTVLVIPFRLSGFGPYQAVLEGLSYRASEAGILPHEAVTDWIEAEYERVVAHEGWNPM